MRFGLIGHYYFQHLQHSIRFFAMDYDRNWRSKSLEIVSYYLDVEDLHHDESWVGERSSDEKGQGWTLDGNR